jgi:DNA-binding protein HU-beta
MVIELLSGEYIAFVDPSGNRHGAFPAALPSFGLQKRLNSKRMTKQQLIEKVAAKTELRKIDVEAAVDSVLALIEEALRSNERVDIRGFGSFVVKEKKERQGRNPRTGETITIPAKRDASFRPGKELTEKLARDTAPKLEEVV